ncbi:MAG: 3-ketoacyl-ACP reductase [Verrucomicrobia bacterium]|nr:3-ketoacyl-ACP reductase [Verrucomicrobiota bacterium]
MNRVALITGGSRGIGRGIALELSKIGMDVVINYASNEAAAQETAASCMAAAATVGNQIRVEICKGDISSANHRIGLVEFTRKEFDRLDLLVNNAGITSIGRADVLDATEENFDRLMAINLKGPYFLTQQAAKWMIDQTAKKAPSGTSSKSSREALPYRPKIVTISSVSAYAVSTNRGDYCMAKAALGMLTKIYATRLAECGINVYEICPGVIASDMTAPVKEKYDRLIAEGMTPIARWGTPEDVGKAVVAIAQDFLPFSTGEVINVDGGFHLRRL